MHLLIMQVFVLGSSLRFGPCPNTYFQLVFLSSADTETDTRHKRWGHGKQDV